MSFFSAFTGLLSDDPALRMLQGGLIAAALVVIFLLFYATRDILLRTRSFLYQFFCIVLVALLPGIGFLLYLLIRPTRTLKERDMEEMLSRLVGIVAPLEEGEGEGDQEEHDGPKGHKNKKK